jgi:hypothetical protein
MSYDAPPPPPPGGPGGPPGGGYGGGYGPGYGGGYAAPQTSTKAIWALVTGLVGLLCCGLIGIAGIVLGNSAKQDIDRSQGALTGRGMAQAGFVIGIIAVVWFVVSLLLLLGGVISLPGSSTSP